MKNVPDTLRLIKAMSNETRLRILTFLMNGELCVCKILPKIDRSQSTVSGQLKKLADIGLVASRRNGKHILYRLNNEQVKKMLKCLGGP